MNLSQLKHKLYFALVRVLSAFAPGLSYVAFAGAGSARQLCQHIVRDGACRILVVTDKQLRELGLVAQAVAALEEADVELVYYDGILPDPTFAQVAEGVAVLREHRSELVLAIGGGSSIDAAKVIAACAQSDDDPRTWVGIGKVKHEMLPLYVIPTTSGTGSEATMGAVISDNVTHEKSVLSGRGMLPAAVAIDSDLLLGMPAPITAATGIDALTHAIEAYICIWERGTRTEYSRRAIRMIFRHLPVAYSEPDNRAAREGMAMAAYYAGIAINQVNVGNVHAIAHQLGGKYGIPHGMANALVLPHVLEFCRHEAQTRLAELARLIGVATEGSDEEQQALAFIAAVRELRSAVGIGERSEKIKEADFDYLVGLAVNEGAGYLVPRLLDADSARAILAKIAA